MAKITITIEDRENDGLATNIQSDMPIPATEEEATPAQVIGVVLYSDLVDSLRRTEEIAKMITPPAVAAEQPLN